MINIRIKDFEGPLDLLLQLIELQQLDISTVSLAEVTDQYLGTLERVEQVHPDELADFLVVAAKLLLIKSRILLPQFDFQEDEGVRLEDQLKLYRMFVGAAVNVEGLYQQGRILYGREHPATLESVFVPPIGLTVERLHRAFQEIVERCAPVVNVAETTIARTVSLHEKIESIRVLIRAHTALSFRELLERATTRMEVIVTFLALLEIVKQRNAVVVQEHNFSDIRIEQVAPETQYEG